MSKISSHSTILNEIEVYRILKDYGINTPEFFCFDKEYKDDEVLEYALKLPGEKVVVKIVSSKNIHKTDTGGIKIVSKEASEIEKALGEIASIEKDGIAVVEFLPHLPTLAEEILIGIKYDDAFGYILTVGPGGTYTERIIKSVKNEYLPEFLSDFSDEAIYRFVENSWTFAYPLGKVRGVSKRCDIDEIVKTIKAFVRIVEDFEKKNRVIEELEVNPFIVCAGRLYAADGVLRFKETQITKRDIPTDNAIKSILQPKTIAFCGVSEKKYNLGRIILNNTIKAGFPRENLYIIKEGVCEIDGVKCYSSLSSVPDKVDMYVVAVPVDGLMDVLEDISESGKVNGVVLITGGVGEKSGTEGVQEKIIKIVEKAKEKNPDFALNGGNCMGMVLNRSKVNTFFIPEYKMKPPVGKNPYMVPTAFVSQSGAFVISTLTKIPHIIPDYTITVGNQQDLTVVDYVDYLSKEDIKVILCYIEGFKSGDGKRLVEITKRMRKDGKILIIYKAGRTSIGQKAVMGHTASIAGDYIVFEKILKDCGAIICDSFDEFCDLTAISTYAAKCKIKNLNAFFISNAGFETTGMADHIRVVNAEQGNEFLKNRIEEILKKHKLDSIVDFKNPMDLTPMASDQAIAEIIRAIYESGIYSFIFTSAVPLTPSMNTIEGANSPDRIENSFINLISDLSNKDDVFIPICVASGDLYNPYVDYAISKGFVVFRSVDRMVRAVEKYISSLKGSF